MTFTLKDQFGDAVDCADLRIARRNSNKVIKTVTTNSRGKATVKLAPGKYQVNGTALPDGYWWESVADTKGSPVKQFTVGEKSLTVGLTCVSRTEQVTITTKDIHTGENLGKVGLQIYDGDGKKVLATRTGAKGKKTIAPSFIAYPRL